MPKGKSHWQFAKKGRRLLVIRRGAETCITAEVEQDGTLICAVFSADPNAPPAYWSKGWQGYGRERCESVLRQIRALRGGETAEIVEVVSRGYGNGRGLIPGGKKGLDSGNPT